MAFSHILQDLQYLSDGLAGRSKNPVALLFDTLMQPNADIAESHPPSLSWTLEPDKAISHVVLGKGRAGGSWHRMQPDVRSLSTGRWLQLPIYQYEDWQREMEMEGKVNGSEGSANGRVTLRSVARYYEHYIEKMGISGNFRNGVTVTQVQSLCPVAAKKRRSQSCESTFSSASMCSSDSEPARCSRDSSPVSRDIDVSYDNTLVTTTPVPISATSKEEEIESAAVCDSDDTGISCCVKRMCLSREKNVWVVRGRKVGDDGIEHAVSVCAKNIVLATGIDDSPKRLKVPGEDLDYVHHNLSGIKTARSDHPILVVGAGLSAADAILHALSSGLTVVHAFHQNTSDQRLIYRNMDPKVYSEYVKLFQMMRGKLHDPSYTPLPQHTVQEFSTAGVCTLCDNRTETTKNVTVSLALVLIGGQAQLDFLPECISCQLGLKPDQPIEPKKNPMDIDAYSFEAEQFPSLFAMGPLAGDNFVRFVLGGAIGITKKLREKLCK